MDKLVESLPADLLAYELEHRLRNGFGPEGDEQDDSEERKEGERILDADGGLDQLTHNESSRAQQLVNPAGRNPHDRPAADNTPSANLRNATVFPAN